MSEMSAMEPRIEMKSGFPSRQSGLTLLEIMITVVILSLGLLGLAGLQITGLKNNRNAYYNTVAAQVVQDLAERIKADQAGVTANNYNALFDDDAIVADATQCGTGIGVVDFADRAACLVANLPGGQVRVREITNGSNTFYVAARWTDLELGANTGWSGATAILACGAISVNTQGTNCYYNVVMP
ncbi:MAG: type IV pilus modification protein PilV [Gammaproteobacteria bacterium]|nr:type IV pilus modification protein PilV [Gammaproteobacteria bacterium]